MMDCTCYGIICVHAPSHQIVHSQETQDETHSVGCPAEAEVLGEGKGLQAEVQTMLKVLQQQQDQANLLEDDKVHKATIQLQLFVKFSVSFKNFHVKNTNNEDD